MTLCSICFEVKYFQIFGMKSKIFQVDHQNRWLSTEATGARGSMTRSLELAVRMVAPTTGLPTISIRAVSPVIGPSTPVDKMMSSITRYSVPVAVRHLWPPFAWCSVSGHRTTNTNHLSGVTGHKTDLLSEVTKH